MRRTLARVVVGTLWIAGIAGLLALGTWQVERLAWKRALIAQVAARLKAAPVAAPLTAGPDDAYRRVRVAGNYRRGADSLVQASTVLGPGWWVMTPLDADTGATVLVNRGYVPKRVAPPPPAGPSVVTGLLRSSEPGGGFLRSNDAAGDRWYSRDVAAIAARRGLGGVAPYFIDADAGASAKGGPVGGLTVVRFANNHLAYAITWYVLAAMTAAAFLYWAGLWKVRGR